MNYNALLDEVSRYARQCFGAPELGGLAYHNLAHTERVVVRAEEIGRHHKLEIRDWFVLHVAAWFHDLGYGSGGASGHEQRGADLAMGFLEGKDLDPHTVDSIAGCILATKLPQKPDNLLQKILCDADLYHFGTEEFREMNKLMRRETNDRSDQPIGKAEWRHKTIAMLEAHQFHTDYCRNLLAEQKEANLEKLREKEQSADFLAQKVRNNSFRLEAMAGEARLKKGKRQQKKLKKAKRKERPDKGIETMFRVSSSNHQRLSDMADNKANIMITTTSIIISVLLSVVVGRLDTNFLQLPNIILLTVCVVTMVFSILATRPQIPDGRFTREDVDAKRVNLLFFGNFYRMSYQDYSQSMNKVMADREFLYGSLTRDVYSQGVVLGRKYRLLRIAYSVFMFGIIVSVVAFIASAVLSGSDL